MVIKCDNVIYFKVTQVEFCTFYAFHNSYPVMIIYNYGNCLKGVAMHLKGVAMHLKGVAIV